MTFCVCVCVCVCMCDRIESDVDEPAVQRVCAN